MHYIAIHKKYLKLKHSILSTKFFYKCNYCPTQDFGKNISQDGKLMAMQTLLHAHSRVHEQNVSSSLSSGRCSPPKLVQPWENDVVLPPTISNPPISNGIMLSHMPHYSCAPLHKTTNTCLKPLIKNNVVLCQSCSPPHDQIELPPRFLVASSPSKTNIPILSTSISCPKSLTSSLTCPNLQSISCHPSNSSSISSLNFFPYSSPHSKSKLIQNPHSTQVGPKSRPPSINSLQFINPRVEKKHIVQSNKNASQGSQVNAQPLSLHPHLLEKAQQSFAKIPSLQTQKQPSISSHLFQNQQPLSKPMSKISQPKIEKGSSLDCASQLP